MEFHWDYKHTHSLFPFNFCKCMSCLIAKFMSSWEVFICIHDWVLPHTWHRVNDTLGFNPGFNIDFSLSLSLSLVYILPSPTWFTRKSSWLFPQNTSKSRFSQHLHSCIFVISHRSDRQRPWAGHPASTLTLGYSASSQNDHQNQFDPTVWFLSSKSSQGPISGRGRAHSHPCPALAPVHLPRWPPATVLPAYPGPTTPASPAIPEHIKNSAASELCISCSLPGILLLVIWMPNSHFYSLLQRHHFIWASPIQNHNWPISPPALIPS